MLFNSWGYLLFLLLAVALFGRMPTRARLPFLALASLAFYAAWRWQFCLLVVFSAVVDFVAARRIHDATAPVRRRAWLLVSLTVNLGLLVFFKYTYFIYDNVRVIAGLGGGDLPDLGLAIVLPLGISFYTFQTISYSIDVYRRVARPVDGFWAFLTYVTFWPQLIAGPILRVNEVVPQLRAARRAPARELAAGAERVVIGLFKKSVLADNIAPLVDRAFALEPATMTAFDVWVAAFLFGFQIYFDFSGYSDIAIGSARMLGLRFPENFDWPYLARSPRDFWRRWHISLSSWIRDYVYLPLTGERFRTVSTGGIATATRSATESGTGGGPGSGDGRTWRRDRALLVTWLLMGLWHGAGWTFALWGLYHAAAIWLYRRWRFLARATERAPLLGWALMLLTAMAGWIPFRAHSLDQAWSLYAAVLDPRRYVLAGRALGLSQHYAAAAALLLAMLATYGLRAAVARAPARLARALAYGRLLAVAGAVLAIWIYIRPVRQFIYFQF